MPKKNLTPLESSQAFALALDDLRVEAELICKTTREAYVLSCKEFGLEMTVAE